MRDIKFRAFNKATGKMIDLYKTTPLALDANLNCDGLFIPFKEGYEIMQFTGLTDKNGKEIYEGDVIEHYRNDSDEENEALNQWKVRCIVKWDSGYAVHGNYNHSNPQFIGQPIDEGEDGSYDWCEFYNCEVIGNIYENPELITP